MGILKRDFQNFSDHFRFFLFTYLLLKFSSFWKTILMYFLHFSNHVNMRTYNSTYNVGNLIS